MHKIIISLMTGALLTLTLHADTQESVQLRQQLMKKDHTGNGTGQKKMEHRYKHEYEGSRQNQSGTGQQYKNDGVNGQFINSESSDISNTNQGIHSNQNQDSSKRGNSSSFKQSGGHGKGNR